MMKMSKLIKLVAKDSYVGFQTFLMTVAAVLVFALAIAFKDSWHAGGIQLYRSLSIAIGIPVIFGMVLYVILAYAKSVESWQNAKLVLLPTTKWRFVLTNLVVRLLAILVNVTVASFVYQGVDLAIRSWLSVGKTENPLHMDWQLGNLWESSSAMVSAFLFVNLIGLAVNLGIAHLMPKLKHAKVLVFMIAFMTVFIAISFGETYLLDFIGVGDIVMDIVDVVFAIGFVYGIYWLYAHYNDAY